MAHNPKLQIFDIRLRPKSKKDSTACFRDVITQKMNLVGTKTDMELWDSYWREFVRSIDVDFIRDEKNNKAFTAYNTSTPIRSNSTEFILDGIIKGGKYNIERDMANMGNKEEVEKISKENIIRDQFYFMLYTPLNDTKGVLLLQTYTEDSIYSAFSKFIISFFRNAPDYFDLRLDSFVPEKLRAEFQKKARLKGFSFSKRDVIGNIGEGIKEELEEFDITIRLTPKNSTPISRTQSMLNKIRYQVFNKKELNDYTARVYLTDENKKAAYYDIEQDITKIKPTIYLENRVSIDQNTGLPNFDELRTYCLELLATINHERSKNEQIDEASILS